MEDTQTGVVHCVGKKTPGALALHGANDTAANAETGTHSAVRHDKHVGKKGWMHWANRDRMRPWRVKEGR